MRNKDMLKKMPVKCVTAIMIATMSMTPVAATLAFPVTAYAAHLEDNPEGSTTAIGAGDTMDNNWGTISSNEGTLNNNEGTVTDNSGTVENNWGDVTNSASGSVETNHEGGNVTNGNITNNYGNAHNSEVANNFASGTVTGSDSRVTDNFGRADSIGQVTNNYGAAIDTDVVTNYESGTVTKQGEAEVYVSDNYAESSHIGDGVTLSDEEGYGQHEVVAGPKAGNSTQTDPQPAAPVNPNPTAPAPVQDPISASTQEDPAQAPAQEPTQDTWPEIPPETPPEILSDTEKRDQIVSKLGTATWNNTRIVFEDGTVLALAELAILDCATLKSTVTPQNDLIVAYVTIFVNAIVSNDRPVALAREEAFNVITTLEASLAEDLPSYYTPEQIAEYKKVYIQSFLDWIMKGGKLDGAQGHARNCVYLLSYNWVIEAPSQTAAVTPANAATAIAPVNTATAMAPVNTNMNTSSLVSIVALTPPGGTAVLSIGSEINAVLAAAISARNDITVNVIYDLGGNKYRTTIPAGSDISFIAASRGGIPADFLMAMFHTTPLD